MKKIILKIITSYIILMLIYLVHSTSAMIIYDIREYYNKLEATKGSLFIMKG